MMQDQEGEGEPAHHARRPMNAFLIFCKRHRAVVRDKYPNLENRSITKILGEWWANLDKEEKACYTGLAKQYKDAFFNANPDFKWYKLPAPPLRTLSSRFREAKSPDHDYIDLEITKNNYTTKLDLNKNEKQEEPKTISMFTPGKLADEANMGGLSSLLETKTDTHSNPYYSPISNYRSHSLSTAPREKITGELQNALTETLQVFEDLEEKKKMYSYSANDQLTNQDGIDQIVDKRFTDEDYGYQRTCSDDEKNRRSGRSCKGKRYQEFMTVGGLIGKKRQKRDYNNRMDEYTSLAHWEPGSSRSEDSTLEDSKPNSIANNSTDPDKYNAIYTPEPENANKTFKAADFDLDAKIRALPSLSLEKFQQKKRENKRKKKTVNLKPKTVESSYLVNSVPRPFDRRSEAECWRETVIGSQKRKPRKTSITRLEINSLVSREEHHTTSPAMMIATEAPYTGWQSMEVCRQPHSMEVCRQPHNMEVCRQPLSMEVCRQPHSMEVCRQPHSMEVCRQPHSMEVCRQPHSMEVCRQPHSMELCRQPHSVDLLALATLAEVASNTSKLEVTLIPQPTAGRTSPV